MERLNTSVDIDWELWREDIAGSIAHAEGLARAGVLTNAEALSIVTGLQQIKGEIERGEFFWDRKKEDVHMNIEAALARCRGARRWQVAHRPLAQRSGRDRPAAVDAQAL